MKNQIRLGASDAGTISIDEANLIDSKMIIQAVSGGGKSGIIRLVCERIKSVPFIILDLEGEFASLREKVDAILVGPNGDIPIDIRSAPLLARKLVELRVSAIIDLYEFPGTSTVSVIQRRREYVKAFLDALVNLPKSHWQPTLIILDELQVICPERGGGTKDVISTQAVLDLIALGRKRGFGVLGATQRFAKVHNDALAELKNVFIGGTWLDADQKKAGDYLGLTGNDRRMLRELKKQAFYCFGPGISIAGINKFTTDRCETTFPKAGEKRLLEPPKASDAIRHIVAQIDDLPAEAEQEKKDVASLRTENADLKRQLAERPTIPEPVIEYVDKEVPIMSAETIQAATELADSLSHKIVTLSNDLALNAAEFEQVRDDIHAAVATVTGKPVAPQTQAAPIRVPAPKPVTTHAGRTYTPPPVPSARVEAPVVPSPASPIRIPSQPAQAGNGDLTPNQGLILGGIALLAGIGEPNPTIAQVGAVIGKSHNSGPIRGAFNKLHDIGLAEITGSHITLTVDGRAVAVLPPIHSRSDIHNLWFDRLKGNELSFLKVLIDAWPIPVTLPDLGAAIGKNINSGPIRGALNALADKGLAIIEDDVALASSLLFPDGLA